LSGRGRAGTGDFWSRRRAAVAAEARAETAAEEEARLAAERAALEDRPDDEVLDALGLKDPDTLEPGDDFSAFLKSEVPDRLRRRALRRLWRSNPTLANLDGLVDYDEDFTDAATVSGDFKTAYRVGKGMLAHIERQLAGAPEPGLAAAAAADDAPQDDVTAGNSAPAPAEDPAGPGRAAHVEAPSPEGEETPAPLAEDAMPQPDEIASPRRMRFVYNGTPKEQT
jgi:hypothetical protein